MKILVFDTETISVNRPLCYNIGYVIYDTETEKILCTRDFVVEQVWHNQPLFESAYYYDKRPLYINRMRARQTEMNKYGFIQRMMRNDIEKFQVDGAYAFNSSFDDKVFNYNSNYYHCMNALDGTPIFDIRPYAIKFLVNDNYKTFCNQNENVIGTDGISKKFITDADGYKTTAESFTCYLNNNADYCEEHTALSDSIIELAILIKCIEKGAIWQTEYTAPRSLPRNKPKTLKIKKGKNILFETTFSSKTERKIADGLSISLRD